MEKNNLGEPEVPVNGNEKIKANPIESSIPNEGKLPENAILKFESELEELKQIKDKTKEQNSEVKALKEKIKIAKILELDRKNKPLPYFAVERSNNPIIIDHLTDKNTGLLDLRNVKKNWEDVKAGKFQETERGEGFYDFNIYGYVKIIQNADILRNDEGMDIHSDIAIYEIMGPNGEITATNVKGYKKAEKIYQERIKMTKKIILKDFEKQYGKKKKVVLEVEKESEKNTTEKFESSWTKNDEKTLNHLLLVIEKSKKRLEKIDSELAKIHEEKKLKEEINQISDKKENGEEKIENKEIKEYSPEIIKEKITKLLSEIKEVKTIDKVVVNGTGNLMNISAEFVAKKLIKINVKLTAILKNENNKINLGGYKINAGALSPAIELIIKPKLDQVSDLIKEYIEKEENRKIEKMWINDGVLKTL